MPRLRPLFLALLGCAPLGFGYYMPNPVFTAQTATLLSLSANANTDGPRRAFVKEYLDCAYGASLTRLRHSDTATFWREARRSKFDSAELAPALARIDSTNAGLPRLAAEDTVENRVTCDGILKARQEKAANGNALAVTVLALGLVATLVVLLSVH